MGSNCRTCGYSEADEESCGPEPPCPNCAASERREARLREENAKLGDTALPPRIRELLRAASPRPWTLLKCSNGGVLLVRPGQTLQVVPREDADLILALVAWADKMAKKEDGE
jgi:hypothetical protein